MTNGSGARRPKNIRSYGSGSATLLDTIPVPYNKTDAGSQSWFLLICPNMGGGVTNLGLGLAITQTFSVLNICDSPIRLFLQIKNKTSFSFPYSIVISHLWPKKQELVQSSVADPWHIGTDPDPHLWLTDSERCNKIYLFFPKFFAFYLLKIHQHHFSVKRTVSNIRYPNEIRVRNNFLSSLVFKQAKKPNILNFLK